MSGITYNGKTYPVHFGLRAINQFAKDTGANFNKVVTAEEAVTAIDAIVKLGVLGLNDGARKAGAYNPSDAFTEDDVWDMCDDDPSIVLRLADIFLESIRPLNEKLDGLVPNI